MSVAKLVESPFVISAKVFLATEHPSVTPDLIRGPAMRRPKAGPRIKSGVTENQSCLFSNRVDIAWAFCLDVSSIL
jgi:hypothetical protein